MGVSRIDRVVLVLTTYIGKQAGREVDISAVALDAGCSLANSGLKPCQL